MAKIILSPSSNVIITPPSGTSDKKWFETNFINPNFDTEKSVAFDKNDLKNVLIAQTDCVQLVLSKQDYLGKKTLSIAGIDDFNSLQLEDSHTVFLGNHFTAPTSTKQIQLDFSQLIGDDPVNQTWDTPYTSSGLYEVVIGNYQEKPAAFNHFSTVNFDATKIKELCSKSTCTKVAFLPGFVRLTTKRTTNGGLDEIMAIETLIAVAINAANEIVGLPVIPLYPWPVKYPPYG